MPNLWKTGTLISDEMKEAIYLSWLNANGNSTLDEIGNEFGISGAQVSQIMDSRFEKQFPTLISTFGKRRKGNN